MFDAGHESRIFPYRKRFSFETIFLENMVNFWLLIQGYFQFMENLKIEI